MRQVALDVHKTFCEVAIREGTKTHSAGRVATERETLKLFAESLCPTDEVAMEATGPAMEIARILRPHVARVVVANAQEVRAISHARVKSDRFDARTLANLLGAGMLESVWVPDPETQGLRRRVARRASLVRQRTRAKKRDPCGALAQPARPLSRRRSVHRRGARLAGGPGAGCRGGRDGRGLPAPDRLPRWRGRRDRPQARRVGGLLCGGEAADEHPRRRRRSGSDADGGDRRRLPLLRAAPAGRLPGPRSQGAPVRRGGAPPRADLQARQLPGALRPVAAAVARKLACIAWQLLTKEEDYVFAQPSKVRAKLRRAELNAGAPRLSKRHGGQRISATSAERDGERELMQRGEVAYRRLIADWKASGPAEKGAGATPGRASSGPSTGQAARQAKAPGPAL